jgi:hypothetical protein
MPSYWWPKAERVPVALRASQKRTIRPAGLVLHTAVSNSSRLVPSGEVRWHFYVNREGKAYQFFPVNRPAAAQLDGNYWTESGVGYGFISVETWDGAGTSVWPDYNKNPSGGPAWTDAQVKTLAELAAWLHTEHGVPLVKATAPRGRGIGYHRQFTNTSPYKWNSSHACPGTRRINQVPGIIARAQEIAKGGSASRPSEDDELASAKDDILKAIADARKALGERHNTRRKEYEALLKNIQENEQHLIYQREHLVKPLVAEVAELKAQLAEIKAKMDDAKCQGQGKTGPLPRTAE